MTSQKTVTPHKNIIDRVKIKSIQFYLNKKYNDLLSDEGIRTKLKDKKIKDPGAAETIEPNTDLYNKYKLLISENNFIKPTEEYAKN